MNAITSQKGFTFIEVMVVIAIFATLVALGLFASMDMYRNYLFRSERDTIVQLLEKARNRSVNNVFESAHGVYIDSTGYTLFRGDSYALSTVQEFVPGNAEVSVGNYEVVFEQLSGSVDPSQAGAITVVYGGKAETVSINEAGQIDW